MRTTVVVLLAACLGGCALLPRAGAPSRDVVAIDQAPEVDVIIGPTIRGTSRVCLHVLETTLDDETIERRDCLSVAQLRMLLYAEPSEDDAWLRRLRRDGDR